MTNKLLMEKMRKMISNRNEKNAIEIGKEKALAWLKKSVLTNGGLPAAHAGHISYQEVTGYTIQTLRKLSEKELAKKLVLWLISVQQHDGSFCAPDGNPYTFDTGQVVRGLLSVIDEMPTVENYIIKACNWILNQIESSGRISTPTNDLWLLPSGKMIPESIHLYVLPPFIEAGRKLLKTEYIDAAHRSLLYYKKNYHLTEFETLSHFFGYIMEALYDLGEIDLVKDGMEKAGKLQAQNGGIPAYPDVKWICSTGMAQLAVVWLKMGIREPAVKALQFLCKIQNERGGFYGSYGRGAGYFPRTEISWGVKYFLDAYLLL